MFIRCALFWCVPYYFIQVECQPYHLEAAGCWNKLKNCLVDIDMFGIWWTPVHKKEFVALWASLTNANNQVRSMTDELLLGY